jgi:hypothetical protein
MKCWELELRVVLQFDTEYRLEQITVILLLS